MNTTVNRVVILTAVKENGNIYKKPRTVAVMSGMIVRVTPSQSTGYSRVVVNRNQDQPVDALIVLESPTEIDAQMTIDPTNDIIAKQKLTLGASAAANNAQSGSTLITKYLTEFTTVTGGSADSAELPATPAIGQPYVVLNNGASTLNVFPNTGDKIDGGAANAKTTIAVNARKTFVQLVAGTWTTCDDYTQ